MLDGFEEICIPSSSAFLCNAGGLSFILRDGMRYQAHGIFFTALEDMGIAFGAISAAHCCFGGKAEQKACSSRD